MRSIHRLLPSALALALAAGVGVAASTEMRFTPTQRNHWAWKRPVAPLVPKVKQAAWVRSPIDAFILSRLEEKGLKPSPVATREQLIRRVAFDLTGLPPTPEEVETFLRESEAWERSSASDDGRRTTDHRSLTAASSGPSGAARQTGAVGLPTRSSVVRDPSSAGQLASAHDRGPTPYEKMVDRYLASPAFGERWARHWLDLARYADTNGYEHDEVRPDAWRYRDYVVRSLNADKPYDRFVQEQIAGDEIDPENPDALIATGFGLLGPDMTDAADQAARRQNTLNDMTDTTGLVFLGMTVGCARCHDHKYEPIPIRDYYRLQSFFTGAKFRTDLPAGTREEREAHARALAAWQPKVKALRDGMDAVAGPVRSRLREAKITALAEDLETAFRTPEAQRTEEQRLLVDRNAAKVEPTVEEVVKQLPGGDRARYEKLAKELKELEARKPQPPTAMGLTSQPEAPTTFILERGELSNKGEEVRPGYPVILTSQAPPVSPGKSYPGRRTALARWLTSPENPLTARVMANRVWQHLMGRGIVPSTSDFGVRGESPTHPELLDWLATTFMSGRVGERENGRGGVQPISHSPTLPLSHSEGKPGSLKSLIRLILNSNAYKQSSMPSAATLAKDPENELFSRMNRKRLESEAVRDSVLAVSGRLNRKMGGPGVFPPMPEDARPKAQVWPVSKDPAEHVRRSLYIFVRRNLQFPQFEVLDSPDTNLSCPRRETSTTAPQALALMNGSDMLESARHLAGRVLAGAPDDTARIRLAYRLAFSRLPSDVELRTGREFLAGQSELLRGRAPKELLLPVPASPGVEPHVGAAWTDYCLALLNINEFVYVD